MGEPARSYGDWPDSRIQAFQERTERGLRELRKDHDDLEDVVQQLKEQLIEANAKLGTIAQSTSDCNIGLADLKKELRERDKHRAEERKEERAERRRSRRWAVGAALGAGSLLVAGGGLALAIVDKL